MSLTPTDEQVEKAARLLRRVANHWGDYDGWESLDDKYREDWRDQARAVLVAVGPMIAAGAFRDFAVEKRAEWAPHACPWVGALDDRATQIEKEAGR